MFSNNLLLGAASISAGGYEVDYSCRFNDADSATLSKTYSGAGTSDKISQIEFWFKRGLLATERYIFSVESNSFQIAFDANDKLNIFYFTSSYLFRLHTAQVFRDPNAWYHLTLHLDTTPSTPSASSMGLLINGVAVTDFDSEPTYPDQDQAMGLGTATNFNIGSNNTPASYYDGYISNFIYCDGNSSSTPYSAEFDSNGVWRPKDVSSETFGDNGFWLDFAVAPDTGNGAGNDVSGKNNDFTDSAGLAANDQVIDTPTNNFPTWSPIYPGGANCQFHNGNLECGPVGSGNAPQDTNVIFPDSGEYWLEFTVTVRGSSILFLGLRDQAGNYIQYESDGDKNINGSSSSYGATFAQGDCIGCHVDVDDDVITFYKFVDGSMQTQGSITSTPFASVFTAGGVRVFMHGNDPSDVVTINYGQLGFTGTPPDNSVALCTTNMPVPTIADPSSHFQPNTRTGDGAGATANVNGATSSTTTLVVDGNSGTIVAGMYVTGTGISGSVTVASLSDQNNLVLSSAQSLSNDVALTFSSAVTQTGNSQFGTDLIIIKNRDQADEWKVVDSVRGATYEINTDSTNAQSTDSNGVTAFSATDGYMIGTGAGGYNDNTEKFIDYHFQEGSTPGMGINASVSHTQGSETTIAHGMSAVPVFALLKETDAATAWWVYHQSLTSKTGNYLVLDTNAGEASISSVWGTQSSTNFVIGDAASGVASGTYVCYSFAEVAGFSSFGKYEGNGSTNGTVVITDFKPALVICKSIDSTSNWFCYDSEREGYNVDNDSLYMDTVDDENTADEIDLLSNGFKLRIGSETDPNVSETYIYAAWAENPFGGHGETFGGGVAPATAR